MAISPVTGAIYANQVAPAASAIQGEQQAKFDMQSALAAAAANEQKKEVEEIFLIYNKKLHGNGNGERYYQKIIALPESEEEKEAMENV